MEAEDGWDGDEGAISEDDTEAGTWLDGDDFCLQPGRPAQGNTERKKKKKKKKKHKTTIESNCDVEVVVANWRSASRRDRAIDPEACQAVLIRVLDHLKERYVARFATATGVGCSSPTPMWRAHVPAHKLELVFSTSGREIQCQPGTGQIEFGLKTIKQEFYDGASSRYPLENEFMRKVCSTKEDVLMWFMLHEFCHLFQGGERHDHAFFTLVLATAQENAFLFGRT